MEELRKIVIATLSNANVLEFLLCSSFSGANLVMYRQAYISISYIGAKSDAASEVELPEEKWTEDKWCSDAKYVDAAFAGANGHVYLFYGMIIVGEKVTVGNLNSSANSVI